jgi:replicative DNA helicase
MKTQTAKQVRIASQPAKELIGSILLDPHVLHQIALIVSRRDFLDVDIGDLYEALIVLWEAGKPVGDITWLVRELAKMDVSESVRTAAALHRFAMSVANCANAVWYAEQIAESAKLLRIKSIGDEISQRTEEDRADPAKIVAWARCHLDEAAAHEKVECRSIAEIGREVIERIEQPAEAHRLRIFSGLVDVDEAMGPLLEGDVCLACARPGCGKSSFVAQAGEHSATSGHRILIVSLEMTRQEIFTRLACSRTGIDSRDLRRGSLKDDERARLRDAQREISRLPIVVYDPDSATMGQIGAAARHTKATGGLDLLILDYVQLVDPPEHEYKLRKFEQLASTSRALKKLAKELQIPILVAAQLNRESDKSEEPRLSHLAECGSFERDADQVLFLHHPAINGPAAAENAAAKPAHVIIGKCRHGPVGARIRVLWHPKETRFSSVPSF